MAETFDDQNLRKVVRLRARPGQAAAMRAGLETLRQATVAEPGCGEFDFYQSITEPGSFLLIEDFFGQRALDRHMNEPHTKAFFALDVVASIDPIAREWLS